MNQVYMNIVYFDTENPGIMDVITGNVSGSEYIDNLGQTICKWMYQGLWDATNDLFGKMNGVLSSGMSTSRNIISKTPEEWNSSAFSFIQTVSENVIIPIAALVFTFIFCWQLISMMKDNNHMHNVTPQNFLLIFATLIICLFVCAHSFEIVNGLFSIAKWAVDHMPSGFTANTGTLSVFPITKDLASYNFGDVFMMFGNMILTLIAELFTYILVAAIYIRVNVWYLELLMYMAVSPLPFSTFMNKEWGQVGMNYLRKILAMTFEGFFMLLAFGLYQAIAGRILNGFATASDEYLMAIVSSIGCGVALLMIISKAGTISASVFNAH